MWFLYILETKANQLYTGITNNVLRRIKEHKVGKGAKFTRSFGVKRLLYTKMYRTKSQALKREIEIKKLKRKEKVALIRKTRSR